MILLFTGMDILHAQAPTLPTLPQRTVNLTLPSQGTSTCPTLSTGSNCIRNVPAGNAASFQSAINAATCGDTIVLAAGSTYSGNFTIPATSCSGWIEIISSALASLPTIGSRVGPANASDMAKISTPNVFPAIQFLPNSNHWRLIGLEITTAYVSTSAGVYNIVSAGLQSDVSTLINAQAQLPSFLIFDRIYLHGLSTTNTQRGIQMGTQSIAIVDSYCDEIHHNGADSQCFASWNGAGPYLIQNNFIQAAGENIMFGGSDPAITNLVPADITIVGNLIQKNTAWRGGAAPYNWAVKNLFELKNAQRVLLDGNIIQYTWAAGQAEAIIIRSADQNGACVWCVVQDITITHNLIRHAPMGIQISAPDSNFYPSLTTGRVLVQNNVLDDISSLNWGGHGWVFEINSNTTFPSPHDITIDHNTSFADSTNGAVILFGDTGTVNNVQVTNLISDQGAYGIVGSGTGSGTPTLTTYTRNLVYGGNVLLNASGASVGTYPAGTFWNTLAGVQFTSYSGIDPTLSGNFQLRSSSPYHNAGTDGKDIGVWDWACLNSDSAAALAGTFVPGSGCVLTPISLSGDLPPQPPTILNAVVQ